MANAKLLLSSLACAVGLALAPNVLAAPSAQAKPSAPAKPSPTVNGVFRPRIGPALGIFPVLTFRGGRLQPAQSASQPLTPVTYHGGQTMTGGLTMHAIFWTGGTKPFQGRPNGAPHDYIGMIEQYLTDIADASTGTSGQGCTSAHCNVFTVEPQFGWGTTPGGITHGDYTIHYDRTADSVIDNHPYPSKSVQCASPQNTAVCVTDAQVQAEIDRLINATGGARGLHDIWYVFTPPDVDECISPGACESNAFGGYHSVSDLGHGPTIYAYTGDPIVETTSVNTPGNDPEGYPDAEIVINIVAHEVNEAMSDPEGVGYMDPNGFEIGDKCEFGPQTGTPLGFAPDGSPFNQVVNGHKYLIQEMWANRDNTNNPDCVQATTNTTNPLPLPQIALTQFSSVVRGNIERHTAGVSVTVKLVRASASGTPVTVASGSTTTAADGSWSVSLGSHAVGDDRDVTTVDYSGAGAPTPRREQILTGNGDNPFIAAGWTGWFDMDNGSLLTNTQTLQGFAPPTITLEPCFQTGLEKYSVGGVAGSESPTDFCNTATSAATAPLKAAVEPGQAVTWSSLDDRAFTPPGDPDPNLTGALVRLTVRAGEPDSVSSVFNPFLVITQGGFPACSGDLRAQTVTCTGLVPGQTYSLTDAAKSASGKADGTGTVSVSLVIKGGDRVALSNGSRTLTTLHIAHLRVAIKGNETVLSGGHCQPDQYYGPPITTPPTSPSAGSIFGGAALTGEICPRSGNAAGLPTAAIAQTDEFSGGQTMTEVPLIVRISPPDGENVFGAFTARARAAFPGPDTRIALQIERSGKTVFSARNVDTKSGVKVSALRPGAYTAIWTLIDANGDTRTMTTQFIEQM
ncbi:MAG TPA: hypothetical protein VN695_01580 [Streptosporangiaceae bacterium]|nr:hypothetical protein [Streptosporangiaceae bacterium]